MGRHNFTTAASEYYSGEGSLLYKGRRPGSYFYRVKLFREGFLFFA